MLRVERQICEHDVDYVFVSRLSSHQRGVHTFRVCRVYLSMQSRPHLVRDSEVSYATSEDEFLFVVVGVKWTNFKRNKPYNP